MELLHLENIEPHQYICFINITYSKGSMKMFIIPIYARYTCTVYCHATSTSYNVFLL